MILYNNVKIHLINVIIEMDLNTVKSDRSPNCCIQFGDCGRLYCTVFSDKIYNFVREQIREGTPEVVFLPDFMKYLK